MKKILLGLIAASIVLGLAFSAMAASHENKMDMDCDAMFKEAEKMLSEDTEAAPSKKAKKYAMAAKAYEKCKRSQKEMKEAQEFFKKVFDTSGKM